MVVARAPVKEALSLKFLLDYVPKEIQKGVNDPETLERLAAVVEQGDPVGAD